MDNLEQTLVDNLGARRIPIHQITSTCCKESDSTLPVIDFDAVKIFFCSKRGIGLLKQLKSADCLHIDVHKRAVCFIEMKDTEDYFMDNLPLYEEFSDFKNAFDKWLKKKTKDLKIKIIDSIFIITAAAGKYSPSTNDVAKLLNKQDVQISYIILMNMTNDDYLTYDISSLNSQIKYPLLAGPLYCATTVLTSDFEDYIANSL